MLRGKVARCGATACLSKEPDAVLGDDSEWQEYIAMGASKGSSCLALLVWEYLIFNMWKFLKYAA